MTVDQLNYSYLKELMGDISTLTSKELANEVMLDFDADSKNKIAKLLSTGIVTSDVQKLHINSLSVRKPENELLTRGQSPWIKTDTGYALTTQPQVLPRFCAKFQTLATSILDPQTYYAIEITLGNFSFDFKDSREEECGEFVIYKNIGLTIYPGKYTINFLE